MSGAKQATRGGTACAHRAGSALLLATLVGLATLGRADAQSAGPAARGQDEIETSSLDPLAATGPARPLFDSAPVPVAQLGITPRWNEIIADGPSRPFLEGCDGAAEVCQSGPMRAFRRVEAENEDKPLPRLVLVRKINLAVNHSVRYQLDSVTWGVEDYWASPRETMAKGAGDCEDFAILKMGMLSAMGIPLSAMQVAVVVDLRRQTGHAVLAVRLGAETYVLDNQTDLVRRDDAIADYQPLYSIGLGASYVYGLRSIAAAAPAASGKGLQPGSQPPGAAAELRGTLGAGRSPARR
jgi:predicted transglutaminase-like cysteine proteinase